MFKNRLVDPLRDRHCVFCKIDIAIGTTPKKYEGGLVHYQCYDWLKYVTDIINGNRSAFYIPMSATVKMIDIIGIPRDYIFHKGQHNG